MKEEDGPHKNQTSRRQRFASQTSNSFFTSIRHQRRAAAVAPWFRLRLLSCGHRFEPQAHHLCFFQILLLKFFHFHNTIRLQRWCIWVPVYEEKVWAIDSCLLLIFSQLFCLRWINNRLRSAVQSPLVRDYSPVMNCLLFDSSPILGAQFSNGPDVGLEQMISRIIFHLKSVKSKSNKTFPFATLKIDSVCRLLIDSQLLIFVETGKLNNFPVNWTPQLNCTTQ